MSEENSKETEVNPSFPVKNERYSRESGKSKKKRLLAQSESQGPYTNPLIYFHVNTVIPVKTRCRSNKTDIFATSDSQALSSFEKYGMYYSFETPSLNGKDLYMRNRNYKDFCKGRTRTVVDVSLLDKYTLNARPSIPHRVKMIEKCPKLKMLYHLKRDLSPQTHALTRKNPQYLNKTSKNY